MSRPDGVDARIEVEIKRGLLQLAVLSMARERTYGYRLCKALAECGLEVEEGTLYPILRRLEGQGLLESLWEMGESRPRKYYRITDEGRRALDALKDSWKRVREAVDGVLEREP
jgi:DNA-binding PadR family transcriptional regulator